MHQCNQRPEQAHTQTLIMCTQTLKRALPHAINSQIQILCCIMLQPPETQHTPCACCCNMLISGTIWCCLCGSALCACELGVPMTVGVYSVCMYLRSWKDMNTKWALTLKQKKNMRPAAFCRPSQALLIYDVIFRLGYIFDASYLSSLILSENSGCVCQPLCT